MAVNTVDVYVSKILDDLSNGLTWYKKDDQGYGSIQEKYNAKDIDILKIRKFPKLKDAETTLTVFNVIDDTTVETKSVRSTRASDIPSGEMVPVEHHSAEVGDDTDSFSAFANI